MTKEKIDTLLEHFKFNGLSLGVNKGDGVDKQESTRSDALLTSVVSIPSFFSLPLDLL